MELIQIIESSVFLFSLGLIVLLILSYLLFKVKNYSVIFPGQKYSTDDDVSIIYEQPSVKKENEETIKDKINKRFIVINEVLKESSVKKEITKKQGSNSRFYIYKPGRNKIVKGLELSKIKE